MKYQTEFCGWTYEYKDGKYYVIPDIPYDEKCETLFKYYALNKYSIEALEQSYIYATHPNQLNDRLDCCAELIDFGTVDCLRNFINNFNTLHEYQSLSNEELMGTENIELFQNAFRMLEYQEFGIFSMTTSSLNLLMWAHYANNNGFCIEFSYDKFSFPYHGPFPINYQKILTPIQLSSTRTNLAMIMQMTTKQALWSYEKEWRIIPYVTSSIKMQSFGYGKLQSPYNHNRKFFYSRSAIRSISLGMSFFDFGETCSEDRILWHVNLNENSSNYQAKKRILDFIITNNIVTYWIQPKNLNELSAIPIHLHFCPSKLNSYCFCILTPNYRKNLKLFS